MSLLISIIFFLLYCMSFRPSFNPYNPYRDHIFLLNRLFKWLSIISAIIFIVRIFS